MKDDKDEIVTPGQIVLAILALFIILFGASIADWLVPIT